MMQYMACPQIDTGNFDFISNGLAINWRHFINDLTRPFWVCTWATRCSTSIPIEMQKVSNAWEVNSPVLSNRIFLIG